MKSSLQQLKQLVLTNGKRASVPRYLFVALFILHGMSHVKGKAAIAIDVDPTAQWTFSRSDNVKTADAGEKIPKHRWLLQKSQRRKQPQSHWAASIHDESLEISVVV
ncbi:MAG: hypothetical protein WBD20_28360 [Pirellulaceae bacterium]